MGPWFDRTGVLVRGKDMKTLPFPPSVQKRSLWGHSKKVTIFELGGEASPEIYPAGTLTLDLQPPKLGENKCLLFEPSRLYYLTSSELTNTTFSYKMFCLLASSVSSWWCLTYFSIPYVSHGSGFRSKGLLKLRWNALTSPREWCCILRMCPSYCTPYLVVPHLMLSHSFKEVWADLPTAKICTCF